MKKNLLVLSAAAFAVVAATAAPVLADDDKCNVPMNQWQPREALQKKLEAEGWKVRSVKMEDGCYEAYAITATGERVEAYFNPETLELVKKKSDD